MHCQNCGAVLGDGAKFCTNCGSPLGQSYSDARTAPVEGQPTQAAQEEPVVNQVAQPSTPVSPRGEAPQVEILTPQGAPQSSGTATAALVCGIAAIVLSGTVILGIILGIVAIALGASAAKQTGDGKAKAGKICGIVGTAFSALLLIVCVVTGFAVYNFIQENPDELQFSYSTATSSSAAGSAKSSSSSAASSSSSSSKSGENSSSAKSSASSASAVNSANSAIAYENKRFGYSLELPSGFTTVSESANGDGASFENASLNMKVQVFGKNNVNNLTPEQLMETWWQGSADTTKESGSNYALFTQVEGDTMHFYYAFVGSGSIDQMEITYPNAGDTSKQLDAAEALVDGFQAGSVAAAH